MTESTTSLSEILQQAEQDRRVGQLHAAEQLYRQILASDPRHPDALHGMGAIAHAVGRDDLAVDLVQRALAAKQSADYYYTLGLALRSRGLVVQAIAAFRAAIGLKGDDVAVLTALGAILRDQGNLDEAGSLLRAALQHNPDFAPAHYNLGLVVQGQGELEQAIAELRTAVRLQPDHANAYSRLLLLLHCDPSADAQTIFQEHLRWNDQFAAHLAKSIPPHNNDCNPDRRLRIGYVSQDFRQQPTAFFVLLLLDAHDRREVEISCYAEVPRPDVLTQQIQRRADRFRSTVGLSDEQVAQLIRTDQIDILVDLSLHTVDNRLLVFARKPAPVQMTYLGYCSTTGLNTIDYRLTDPWLDPQGMNDGNYSEESIRLPETYWCYKPLIVLPVQAPPAQSKGYVTFGCLNNFIKVTGPTLAAFCDLLKSIPDSRLALHVRDGGHCRKVEQSFANQGIDPARLQLFGYLDLRAHLEIYQQIDITLDPFPYGGGTTTCDALYLGVPVVTLAGKTAVGRGGVSILSNIGLKDLIAQTPREYVEIARALAGNLPRLIELRAALRGRMEQSPLMNASRFTRNLESIYRQVWRRWCNKTR